MNHSPYLKLTSQERRDGRMIDVDTVCVCRCGEKFPSDRRLKKHIYEPFAPDQVNSEAASPRLSALAT